VAPDLGNTFSIFRNFESNEISCKCHSKRAVLQTIPLSFTLQFLRSNYWWQVLPHRSASRLCGPSCPALQKGTIIIILSEGKRRREFRFAVRELQY